MEKHSHNPNDPIYVICTPKAQLVICLGCLVYMRPQRLLPIPLFVLAGREFLREHRFCKPRVYFETMAMQIQNLTRSEMREPGEE